MSVSAAKASARYAWLHTYGLNSYGLYSYGPKASARYAWLHTYARIDICIDMGIDTRVVAWLHRYACV